MKNLSFALIVLLILFSSCIDSFIHTNSSFINNQSGLDAKLEFSCANKGNEIINPITLVNNRKNFLLTQSDRSKAIIRSFANNNSTCDSLIIKFSDGKRIVYSGLEIQNRINKLCKNNDCIVFDNTRSILNSSNYEKIILNETKRKLETELIFTLTREDYLKAK